MSWEDDNIFYGGDDFEDDDDPTVWITKDDGVIEIQDMDLPHLRNTIAFITRKIGNGAFHPWHFKRLNMLAFLKNPEAKGE